MVSRQKFLSSLGPKEGKEDDVWWSSSSLEDRDVPAFCLLLKPAVALDGLDYLVSSPKRSQLNSPKSARGDSAKPCAEVLKELRSFNLLRDIDQAMHCGTAVVQDPLQNP